VSDNATSGGLDLVVVRSPAVLLVVLAQRLLFDHVLVLDLLVCTNQSQEQGEGRQTKITQRVSTTFAKLGNAPRGCKMA
jgi:hypothetical protein